jgi:superfamily I DNA and/or RNA helicase
VQHVRVHVPLVISPFVQVADGIRSVTRRHPGLRAGTVHTAQGEETIVVLVLGGGPGARSWAAEKPNLMNVAVSRARHRLYVIGDLSGWTGLPYVGDLARALPVRG